jgi:hypothetical protein
MELSPTRFLGRFVSQACVVASGTANVEVAQLITRVKKLERQLRYQQVSFCLPVPLWSIKYPHEMLHFFPLYAFSAATVSFTRLPPQAMEMDSKMIWIRVRAMSSRLEADITLAAQKHWNTILRKHTTFMRFLTSAFEDAKVISGSALDASRLALETCSSHLEVVRTRGKHFRTRGEDFLARMAQSVSGRLSSLRSSLHSILSSELSEIVPTECQKYFPITFCMAFLSLLLFWVGFKILLFLLRIGSGFRRRQTNSESGAALGARECLLPRPDAGLNQPSSASVHNLPATPVPQSSPPSGLYHTEGETPEVSSPHPPLLSSV